MYHQAQVCVPFAQLTHIPLSAPSTRVVFILGLADQGVLRISHSGHVFSFSPGWLLLTPPPVVPPRSQRPIRRLMFHDLAPLHHLGVRHCSCARPPRASARAPLALALLPRVTLPLIAHGAPGDEAQRLTTACGYTIRASGIYKSRRFRTAHPSRRRS